MKETVTPVEMQKALCLMTETGFPADLEVVRGCYGKHVRPAIEPGWFWIGATAKSAAGVARRGLHARGTLMTTFIPPQQHVIVDDTIRVSDVPAIGSPEFLAEIHLDTEQRREAMLRRKGEHV